MLKIGVLGAGHLGKIHLRLLNQSEKYQLVGFFDPLEENALKVATEFGYKKFDSIAELISAVDVVDIVTPTIQHFECAKMVIEAGKHIFIEKPIATTVEEAEEIVALATKFNVKGQVGHVERFNPAFTAVKDMIDKPMFIETHRLAEFNPRGTDVPVVLDLMIHDIDIVLSVVKSRIKKISASGVAVISDTHDITNARLEFENGAVANLTASRISLKNMRKSRFFQKDAYISVDFLTKELEVVRMQDVIGEADPFDIVLDLGPNKAPKKIFIDKPELQEINAIKEELKSFYDAITQNVSPKVTVEDGCAAMEVAIEIIEKLKQNQIHF